jgi:hypothetical protein
MKWFLCLCIMFLLCVPLEAQNKILVVSSQPENLGDTTILNEIIKGHDFIPIYAEAVPFGLSTQSYSLVILGDLDESDCLYLNQYVDAGGGLILTGSAPYSLLQKCQDKSQAAALIGFQSYSNGSGELKASVDLSQIELPRDSLLDRTPCEIGFGGLTGPSPGAEILAEWYCSGQQEKIGAITRNQAGRGKVFYFSRLLSTIRVRQLLAWAVEDGVEYRWGDADNSGRINLTDAVYIMRIVFHNGPLPQIANAGDVNGDGAINISDAVWLINYIFMSGPAPVAGRID